jgi:hypothetical protein
MAGRAGGEDFSAETAVAIVPEDVGLSGGTLEAVRKIGVGQKISAAQRFFCESLVGSRQKTSTLKT